MTRLPFRRVLLGALLGALAALGVWMLVAGTWPIEDPRPLHRWIIPLGAVLGVRLAVGKGGTARWTALLASLVLWWIFAWVCLEWSGFDQEGFGVYALNLLILLGGWSVLVWRAMEKLEGGALAVEALPLTLIGLSVDHLMQGVLFGLNDRFVPFLFYGAELVYVMSIMSAFFALVLVGGLGSMAALAGRLDVRWGNACMSAGLMGVVMAGGMFLMDSYVPSWLDFQPVIVFWFVFELAWFSWWGHRLARKEEA